MQQVARHVNISATLDDARKALAEHADLAAYLRGLSPPSKSKSRKRLLSTGYKAEVVDVLIPIRKHGPLQPNAALY